jgi:GTPase SAR1 family protein
MDLVGKVQVPIVLVGNKSDLSAMERVIDEAGEFHGQADAGGVRTRALTRPPPHALQSTPDWPNSPSAGGRPGRFGSSSNY